MMNFALNLMKSVFKIMNSDRNNRSGSWRGCPERIASSWWPSLWKSRIVILKHDESWWILMNIETWWFRLNSYWKVTVLYRQAMILCWKMMIFMFYQPVISFALPRLFPIIRRCFCHFSTNISCISGWFWLKIAVIWWLFSSGGDLLRSSSVVFLGLRA